MAQRRNPKGGLHALFEQSPEPIYVLDDERRILYANPAAALWLGLPIEQLVGATCNYHSRDDADLVQRIAASLCPPLEAFAGAACAGEVGEFAASVGDGKRHAARRAHFCPVAGSNDGCAVVAFVDASSASLPSQEKRESTATHAVDWHRELVSWRKEHAGWYRLDRLLGVSESMRGAQRVARAAIASGADTLIVGPIGGGMEQIARAIHYSQYSSGSAPPLVPLDCAIGDGESLHLALRQVQSDRERTAKGRLLLLHADRMDSRLMNELAGFVALPHFDIGILSTSEQSLREMAGRNQFDAPLANHLSTLEIQLPPLRDRIQDLAILCQALIEDFNAEGNQQFSGIHADAIDMLCQYPWPRNVDELAQVIHNTLAVAKPPIIRAADLPKQIQSAIVANRFPQTSEQAIELPAFLREIENELMRRAIRISKGNKAKAARLLGVSRQRVIRWSEQTHSE